MNILKASTTSDLALGTDTKLGQMRMLLVEVQSNLTPAVALAAPKIFQLQRDSSLGKGPTLKLLVFVLKSYQDSLKVANGMEAADLIECAEMILKKYSHDSLKDVMLALKESKWNGTIFYNALSGQKVMEVLDVYFQRKADWLEDGHKQLKATPAPDLLALASPELVKRLMAAIVPEAQQMDEQVYQRQRADYLASRAAAADRDLLEQIDTLDDSQLLQLLTDVGPNRRARFMVEAVMANRGMDLPAAA